MNRMLLRKIAAFRSVSGLSQRQYASADRIRTSIQKLLVNEEALHNDNQEVVKTRDAAQLQSSLDALKKQLNEATQCVNDCKQEDGEIGEAEQAVDQAVLCLLDVVETKMQHPTEDYVKKIRDLREELGNLSKPHDGNTEKSSASG